MSLNARSLIGGVCKEIIFNNEGKENEDKPPLPELLKDVRNHLNLAPSNQEPQKPLKEVVNSAKIVADFLFHTYEYQRKMDKIKKSK
ncbi:MULTISPECIES: hypothetical protein [Bacillaceae]|uniref:hypothetical protein n=1 Tax=Bacillaceae TaxID=186817 RepID=UPI0006618426|nr:MULTISPECIES: hypothetical protein [Bacillaceae]MCF7620909.1 hypothetical protein [Peribacillus frigoritolerans]PRA87640.1 hypothetical protein CQ056_14295 [Peribacillus simplex]